MFKSIKPTFRNDEDGSAAIELVLLTPMVVSLFVVTLSLFDAYRAKFGAQAATYTIADMVSRETVSLSADYVDGMLGAFDAMAHRSADEQLRLSVLKYDEETQSHSISWSETRGGDMAPLTTAEIADVVSEIPVMGHLDSIIFVETESDYAVPVPLISDNILDDFKITNTAFVTPRFATTVCYQTAGAVDVSC